MRTTATLAAILLSTIVITAVYLAAFLPGGAPGWAPWIFMIAMSAMMVATMALGAARHGSIGRLRISFVIIFLILVGGFGAALALPPTDPTDPTLWLGLPPRAAIIMYGIGLVPYLIVPLAYAWTFKDQMLGPGDLDRIRDEALRVRGEMPLERDRDRDRHRDRDRGRDRTTDPDPEGSR